MTEARYNGRLIAGSTGVGHYTQSKLPAIHLGFVPHHNLRPTKKFEPVQRYDKLSSNTNLFYKINLVSL